MKIILIVDTFSLCALLKIPGKESSNDYEGEWNLKEGVVGLEKQAKQAQAFLMLPLATIIETGNHIARDNPHRYQLAQELGEIIKKAATGQTPWIIFNDQYKLWRAEELQTLSQEWPEFAKQGLSMGDTTIIKIVESLKEEVGCRIDILTGDKKLKAYEYKPSPLSIPRRNKR